MKLNREKFELTRARSCMGFKDLQEAGIPKGTLCRLLSGANGRPETFGKIAKALKCDVTEIIETN